LSTIAVKSKTERKKFTLAAFNAGEGRIARAQKEAKLAGDDPTKWDDIKKHLQKAGSTLAQAKETIDYIEKILPFELEFIRKSPANENIKNKEPLNLQNKSTDCHWVTIDDNPVCIDN